MSTEVDPEKNPLLSGDDNLGYDEDGEHIQMENLNQYDSSRSGSVDPTSNNRTQEETSLNGEPSETEKLVETSLKKIAIAEERIKRKFPKFNPANSPFTFDLDKYKRVIVRLNRYRGKYSRQVLLN